MKNINKLNLEQEFKLTIYKNKIIKLNEKRTKYYLKKILRIIIIKDNIIKYYTKNIMK